MRATKEVERKNGEDTEDLRQRAHTVRATNNGRTEAFAGDSVSLNELWDT